MKRSVGIVLLIVATGAQARNWVPVATRPDNDMTGLYVDRDSIKGRFHQKRAWEKFINSYGEQRMSLIEMDCGKNRWRAVKMVLRSPTGVLLKRSKSPNSKSKAIDSDPSQKSARALVCKLTNDKH